MAISSDVNKRAERIGAFQAGLKKKRKEKQSQKSCFCVLETCERLHELLQVN